VLPSTPGPDGCILTLMDDPNRDSRSGRFVNGNRANAAGRNQYDYRRRVQGELDELLKRDADNGGTVSRALLDRIIEDALSGAPHAQRLVWSSLVPKLEERHMVEELSEVSADELATLLGEAQRNMDAQLPDADRKAVRRARATLDTAFARQDARRGNGRDHDA